MGGEEVHEGWRTGYVNLREKDSARERRERNEKRAKSRAEPSEGCKRGGKGGGEAEGARELAKSQRVKATLSLSPSPPYTRLFPPAVHEYTSDYRQSLTEQETTP